MQRSLHERDACQKVSRPFVKDSNLCIGVTDKNRQKKKIPVIHTIRSDNCDTPPLPYQRKAAGPHDGPTARRSEKVVRCSQKKGHERNVEAKQMSKALPTPRENAKKSPLLQSKSDQESLKQKISLSKCQCRQPRQPTQEKVWKRMDPHNLVRIEPTHFYVYLPPSGRKTQERKTQENTKTTSQVKCLKKPDSLQMQALRADEKKLCLKCKEVRKSFEKATDCEILFGRATLPRPRNCGWNKARLEWMIDLERRQEVRKKRQKLWMAALEEDNEMDLCCFPFLRNIFVWHF